MVPCEIVKRLVIELPPVIVKLSIIVHSPPAPLKVKPHGSETELVVTVLPVEVELNVIVPVLLKAIPDTKYNDPDIAKVEAPSSVGLPPDGLSHVILKQVAAESTVTV
jgi:hypothetical protein